MRVLIVVLGPLDAEFGAAQIGLNLVEALCARGVDARAWSPRPIPEDVPWWRQMAWMRRRLDEFIAAEGPFDIIDAPPVANTAAVRRHGIAVARSVQPDLHYLWVEARARHAGRLDLVKRLSEGLHTLYLSALVVAGWYRARHIVCLGSVELAWMRKTFPWWRRKASMYVSAPRPQDRESLAAVRRNRRFDAARGHRFLWLGRWTPHKGTAALLQFIRRRTLENDADTFTIAGCGDDAARQIDRDLCDSGRVKIIPSYRRSELPELLAEHDIGVFTSIVEGWGLTMQEMLESGLTVYATATGAAVDLGEHFPRSLRDFDGLNTECCDIEANPEPDAAYFARFTWTAIADRYMSAVSGRR